MSQFVLCVTHEHLDAEGIEFRSVSAEQAMLREASEVLYPASSTIVVPHSKTGEEMSALFDEAHDAVFNGRAFESTRLSGVLPELLRCCESVALWWGNDWQDLPVCDSPEEFVNEVVKQLREPIGDVYLQWSRH